MSLKDINWNNGKLKESIIVNFSEMINLKEVVRRWTNISDSGGYFKIFSNTGTILSFEKLDRRCDVKKLQLKTYG